MSLHAPDRDQDEQVPDVSNEDGLCLEGQIWEGGHRCYNLINLRKCTPSHAMFRIHYSILNRCITLVASMVTLNIVVSFFSWKTQGGFPQVFPIYLLFIMNR